MTYIKCTFKDGFTITSETLWWNINSDKMALIYIFLLSSYAFTVTPNYKPPVGDNMLRLFVLIEIFKSHKTYSGN